MLEHQTQFGGANPGMIAESVIRQHFSGAYFTGVGSKAMKLDSDYAMDEMDVLLEKIGVGFRNQNVLDACIDYAQDSIQQPLTTPTITTPLQFLQNWLPGIVEVVTAKQSIDEMIGRTTIGSWEDAQIVQQVIEMSGSAVPYTDAGNVPLSNWNTNFVTRTVMRFELGFRVGNLEEAQSARMRVDSAGYKRKSDAIQLEIQRNLVGFYGYNSGLGQTYGFLNDPNLPAYINAPNGSWATSTFLHIQQDILTALQGLRTQSQGRVTPNKDPITMGLPTNIVDYLATPTDFGYSVWAWLKDFYPNVRVVDSVQLNGANGGANVMYLFADKVVDSGTDDQSTFIQVVPATFMLLGIQKMVKGTEEDYSNATAGTMVKRPYAVYRQTGL